MNDTKNIDRYDLLTHRPLDDMLAFDAVQTVDWPAGAVAYRTEWVPLLRHVDGYKMYKPELVVLDANGNELMRSTDHEIRHNQALWDADVYKRQCEHEARLWG